MLLLLHSMCLGTLKFTSMLEGKGQKPPIRIGGELKDGGHVFKPSQEVK